MHNGEMSAINVRFSLAAMTRLDGSPLYVLAKLVSLEPVNSWQKSSHAVLLRSDMLAFQGTRSRLDSC